MSDILIACSDGRLVEVLDGLKKQLRMEAPDRLFIPGGPLVLARPGMERRVALNCIHTLVEAHSIRRIVLVSHQDCAAYERALGGFGFDQRELLARDLRRVRKVLENTFADVEVACFFVPWHESDADADAGFGQPEPVE